MPDPQPVSMHHRLPRRLVAVPRARQLAADALSSPRSQAGGDDDLALVITELVANAVRHGRGRRIAMRLTSDGRLVRIEVENRRWTTLPRRRVASEIRPTGRGLALVAACSRDWGYEAGGRGRTRVWAEVER